MQLAAAVCNAYLDLGARQRADAFVNRVVGKVEAIEALFKLDPVPMTVEQVSAFAACYTSLRMLRFKCAGEAADSDDKVKRELQGGFSADHERLLALAEALQSSKRRTVAHQPPTDGEARLLAAASEILEPNFRTVRRVLEGRRAIRERKEADRKGEDFRCSSLGAPALPGEM